LSVIGHGDRVRLLLLAFRVELLPLVEAISTLARARLTPPSGLSTRERALFREVTDSLPPGHLKLEDVPLSAFT
jgi:hypothetical protein